MPVFSGFNSQDEITNFYHEQFKNLELYLFSLAPQELIEHRVELRDLFHALERSPAIQRILTNGEPTIEATQQIVILLATVLNKAGIYSPLFSIMTYLPDSSIKLRLKAAQFNSRVTNIRTGYKERTTRILDYLKQAQFDDDTDFTQEIIVDFINYHTYVKEKLLTRTYIDEFNTFNAQFSLPEFIEEYPFLSSPSITRYLSGVELDDILLAPSTATTYELSENLYEELKVKVSRSVMRERNSSNDGFFGLSKDEILNGALDRGKTDFRVSYKNLTPDLKVLLYCFFNMKKHFSSSYFIFDKMTNLLDYFSDSTFKPLMIDLGCGPLTSGLALGDYYYSATGNQLPFNYIGIDIAPEMLSKANEFKNMFCFHEACKFKFEIDWELTYDFIEKNVKGKNLVLINASYLFASSILNVESLAKFVNTLVKKYAANPIYFVFQNSNYLERNVNYLNFKELIVGLQTKHSAVEIVKYRTIPGKMVRFTEEEVKYEILSNT